MIKIFNIFKENLIIKLFLFFSFLVCWFSISTSFNDLLILKYNLNLNITNIVNFLRHALVYFCLFFLTIIFLIFNKIFFSKKYLIFYLFIGYLIFQIPGLIITGNSIRNISFIISAFTIIFTMILINQFFTYKEQRIFLYASFLILLFVFFVTFLPQLMNFFQGGHYFYGLFESSDIFLSKIQPRSSGLSRSALIILLFTFLLEEIFIKKKSILIKSFKIFLLTAILLFQSRTTIFLTFLNFAFIFIFAYKISIKNILKYISQFLFLPLILVIIISNINQYSSFKKINDGNNLSVKEFFQYVENKDKSQRNLRTMSEDTSSGRFNDWSSILKKIKNDYIYFGYGSQADRFLIDQSASNGLIYAYSSSGIIGLIFFILFTILVLYKLLKLIIISSFRKEFINYISCLIVLSIILRSILETSYAVFSIDLVIIFLFINIINNNEISINDIKKYFK